MPAPAYIEMESLAPSTRATVLKDYRAHIAKLTRPLTYTEACVFYHIGQDTIRRYVWEGRLKQTTPKGKDAKPGLTHATLREFVKSYEPRHETFSPNRIRTDVDKAVKAGKVVPDPAQLRIDGPLPSKAIAKAAKTTKAKKAVKRK